MGLFDSLTGNKKTEASSPEAANKAANAKGELHPTNILSGANPAALGEGANTPNPLDAFNNLLDNTNKQAPTAPVLSISDEAVSNVSKNIDFLKGMDKAVVSKALSGDAQSLMDLIQHTAQTAYQQSIQHNTAITNAHLGNRADFDNAGMATQVAQHLTMNELSTSIPNYSNKVLQQALVSKAKELQVANPDKSPKEIAGMAKDYFTTIAGAINPAAPNKEEVAATSGTDWEAIFQ